MIAFLFREWFGPGYQSAAIFIIDMNCSAETGERKPDDAFFIKVIEDTGVDPSRTVFIDDKEENVDGARKNGLIGVRFDKEEEIVIALGGIFL